MKNLFSNLAFGAFSLGLIYVLGLRIFDWYQTGQLAIHRTAIDVMGFLGLGVLLREIRE
jgi:hypothetical protein